MATHSSTLAWKIPWTEEPGSLQSIGSLRVGHDWANSLSLFTFMHWRRKWQPTAVFLPGESQGWQSLVGCRLWDRTESDTTEATQQQQQYASWHISPWVYPVWNSFFLLDLINYFLFHVGEIFNYNLFKNFLIPFLPSFSLTSRNNANVAAFDIIPEVSETVLSSFHSFYFILIFRSYFQHFIFQLTASFFCFRYSAIDSLQSILISVGVLFVSVCLFFNSSRSLLN